MRDRNPSKGMTGAVALAESAAGAARPYPELSWIARESFSWYFDRLLIEEVPVVAKHPTQSSELAVDVSPTKVVPGTNIVFPVLVAHTLH